MTYAAPSSPAVATFLTAIDRVEAILDQECSALKALSSSALKELNNRKARSLLEISRAARALSHADAANVRTHLERLSERLERNRSALRLHLDAAYEIASLASRAIAEAESDGTYSAGTGRRVSR